MQKRIIELVCTGNRGRSPVAELIARNYLRKIDADEYEASSSGTLVDKIKQEELPMAFMIKLIDIARSRGDVYTSIELQGIDSAIKDGNTRAITQYYKKADYMFGEEEKRDRQEVLPLLGIEGTLKSEQEQTIQRPDTIAVLSMARTNNQQVECIYASSAHKPVIDVLSRYATNNQNAEIPNAYGLGRKAYIQAVEVLVEQVPLAVERLLG